MDSIRNDIAMKIVGLSDRGEITLRRENTATGPKQPGIPEMKPSPLSVRAVNSIVKSYARRLVHAPERSGGRR